MFTVSLWCPGNAAELAKFYVSVFTNSREGSRITGTDYYPEGSMMPAGTVLSVTFELDGQRFLAINANDQFPFSEAVSLMVSCRDQAEIDHYWDALLAGGGTESQCGWLKDRFGFSWQVVPEAPIFDSAYGEEANARINAAMMQMQKLDLAVLEAARRG